MQKVKRLCSQKNSESKEKTQLRRSFSDLSRYGKCRSNLKLFQITNPATSMLNLVTGKDKLIELVLGLIYIV